MQLGGRSRIEEDVTGREAMLKSWLSPAAMVALVPPLLFNLRTLVLLLNALQGQRQSHTIDAPLPPPPNHAPSPPWAEPNPALLTVARISSSRALDARVMHLLSVGVEVPLRPIQLGASLRSRRLRLSSGATIELASAPPADTSDVLLQDWWLPTAASTNGSSETPSRPAFAEPSPPAIANEDASSRPQLGSAHVLWSSWPSTLSLLDVRLRSGQLVSTLAGLQHEGLGTPIALHRSHRRCVAVHGVSACDFSPNSTVVIGRAPTRPAASSASPVWLAKPVHRGRSPLVHTHASFFAGRHLVPSGEPLPSPSSSPWVVHPWPPSPLLWRHHRFVVRTWAVVTSALPLRAYMLQDAWAHVVAKPTIKSDPLASSYRDRCIHLWSVGMCSVTHSHRIIRTNHDDFASNLVGLPRNELVGPNAPSDMWRRRIWPSIEDAATRALAAVTPTLQRHERMLRRQDALSPYRRAGLITFDWLIDEGGVPVLIDADTDGMRAADDLPLSHQYAADALTLLGIGGGGGSNSGRVAADGVAYGPKLHAAVYDLCTRLERESHANRNNASSRSLANHSGDLSRPLVCTTQGVDEIYALADEAHRAGMFARIIPPVGARGCGRYCPFFANAAVEDRLLWKFLRTHGALMPRRARPPAPRERAQGHVEVESSQHKHRKTQKLTMRHEPHESA